MLPEVLFKDRASLAVTPIVFHDGCVTVGRNPGSDVVLQEMKVSRHHAEFEYKNRFGVGILTVRDRGSMHGTFVNGSKIHTKILFSGDVVQIGRHPESDSEPPCLYGKSVGSMSPSR